MADELRSDNILRESGYNRLEDIVIMETLIIFGCAQLIPLACRQTFSDIAIKPLQRFALFVSAKFCHASNENTNNSQSKGADLIGGILMLAFRFLFFTLLATRVATIWGTF